MIILIFDWLEEKVREKDEWRFATMEYGGQCVTMAGIKWMHMLSADNWVLAIKELYRSVIIILGPQYYWKTSNAIKIIHIYLNVWILGLLLPIMTVSTQLE